MPDKPKLLDQVRDRIRAKNYSYRTEQAYTDWILRYILYHKKKHPMEMGSREVGLFLNFLANERDVSASTQNQALSAISFLYKEVLQKELANLDDIVHAKRSEHVPTVFTSEEAHLVLAHMEGTRRLMASILYGAGLRLMECIRLRVKDIDFGYHQITVHDGKGHKDRVTMLPKSLVEPLRAQIERAKVIHDSDLNQGFGAVYLPYALERKYPNANRELAWQYVFPSANLSRDPRSGVERRHHLDEKTLQRAVKTAITKAGIRKHAGCHTPERKA